MSGPELKRFLIRYRFPAEAVSFLCSAYDRLKKNSAVRDRFRALVRRCQCPCLAEPGPVFEELHSLEEEAGSHRYTIDLLFLLCLIPSLKKAYEKEQIPALFYDSFADHLRASAEECMKTGGVWGTRTGWWLIDFFRMKLFSIGRLQYRWRHLRKDIAAGDLQLQAGTPYADVHIPPGSPLTKEACAGSYAKAAAFFKVRFAQDRIIFCCRSWLLSPDLKAILPAASNILAFAQDYTVVESVGDPDNRAACYIFHTEALPEDLNELPEDTSLQRMIKQRLLAGGNIGIALGVMVYDRTA